ncbi:MAG: hypothetical protein ABI843_12275 [Dokdonella sp.]
MKIELVIDRLVLDGFAPHAIDGAQVRAALGAELARLLRAAPTPPRGSALAFAAGDALPAIEAAHSHALGAGIARSLHGVLAGAPVAAAPRGRTPR